MKPSAALPTTGVTQPTATQQIPSAQTIAQIHSHPQSLPFKAGHQEGSDRCLTSGGALSLLEMEMLQALWDGTKVTR